jgi:serine/threonine protein phosphatase PrpC
MPAGGQVRVATLWGSDHEALGEVAVSEVTPSLAVALSRGRFPKGYPHVDLNEDGALAATDGSAAVLAVADGHNGFAAARAALGATVDQVPYLLSRTRGTSEAALRRCFAAAVRAATTAVEGLKGERAAGGAALTVALLWPGGLASAGLGDCVVAVIRDSRVWRVGRDAPFLGPGPPSPQLAIGRARLRRGDRVLVATDGLRDFLGRGWRRRLAALAVGTGPADLARSAIEEAWKGGAGDNLAVVVAAVV